MSLFIFSLYERESFSVSNAFSSEKKKTKSNYINKPYSCSCRKGKKNSFPLQPAKEQVAFAIYSCLKEMHERKTLSVPILSLRKNPLTILFKLSGRLSTRKALDSQIGRSRCDVASRRSAQPISDARPVLLYTITIKIEPISQLCPVDTLKHSSSRTHELKMLRDASYAAQPIMTREGSFFVCLMSQVPPIRLAKFMSWCSFIGSQSIFYFSFRPTGFFYLFFSLQKESFSAASISSRIEWIKQVRIAS